MEQKGTVQVQQRPPAVSAHASSHLQRSCACGQHTIAGGECEECRKNRELLSERTGVVPLPSHSTPSSAMPLYQAAQEHNSADGALSRESRFTHDFSQVPVRTTPTASTPSQAHLGGEHLSVMSPSRTIGTGLIGSVQAKYEVEQPGDVYEQEADKVASQVALLPERQTDDHLNETRGEKSRLPLSAPDGNGVLNILKHSPGMPLSSNVRRRVEPLFGVDLSHVRVHTDKTAAEAASILHAKAFTHQDHIWLGANQSAESVDLMAHEATHVVQQSAHPATQPAIQRKLKEGEDVEDGEEVRKRMQQHINQALEQAKQQQPSGAETDTTLESNKDSVGTATPEAQKAVRDVDPRELAEKERELKPDAVPSVDRQAEVQPKVEQATQQVKEKSEQPPEPLAQQKAPKPAKEEPIAQEGGEGVVTDAETAADLTDAALTGAGAPASLASPDIEATLTPMPEAEGASALSVPITPVDAKGEPLLTNPELDAQVADLAQQAQTLREQGQLIRARAAEEKGNAKILRGNIGLVQKNIGQAEKGVQRSLNHLAFRRDALDKAQQALSVSEQKATMVANEAPTYAAKADEGKERSGPIASDAAKLSAENKAKTPDDEEASANSREQGEKLNKVGSDTANVDDAISQTKERAGTLAQDAAKATEMNTNTRTKIGTMHETLQQSDERLAQMKEHNTGARAEMEEVREQPDEMQAQAMAVDQEGVSLIQAASDIEQQLQQSQERYAQGLQTVPGLPEPEEEAEAQEPLLTTPSLEEESIPQPQSPSTVASEPTEGENLPQEQSTASEQSAQALASALPSTPAQPSGQEEQVPQERAAAEQQPSAAAGYEQRIHINVAENLPSWLTGETEVSDEERKKAQLEKDQQRAEDLKVINEKAGGDFSKLDAADKAGIALKLTGKKLFNSVSKIQWPGWGKLAKGLIDPRAPLQGVLSGFSMIVSAEANLLNKEQWARDPLGNLLKSAADIATGLTIIFGSITALALLIITILTALTIITLGFTAPVTGPIIAFCAIIVSTVGGWTITIGVIALMLQALVLIKNLIDAATAQTAEELSSKSDDMKEDIGNAANVLMQIGMAKLSQAGGKALSAEIEEAGGGAAYAARLPGKFAQGVKALPGRIAGRAKAVAGGVARGGKALGRGVKGGIGRIKGVVKSLGREGEAEAGLLAARETAKVGTEGEQIASLGKMTRETETMLENNPSLREALAENPRAADALKLCKSYCFPENATPAQIKRLNDLLEQAEKSGVKVDMSDVREFLHSNRASLDDAIGTLEERYAVPELASPSKPGQPGEAPSKLEETTGPETGPEAEQQPEQSTASKATQTTGTASGLPRTTEESVADKLDRYLLNPEHPVGGSKASWFKKALGFSRDNAGDLAKQIVFDESTAVKTVITQHGTKYNQVINIAGANGKNIGVTFAWIRNKDGVVRLVSAIPAKR